MQFVRKVGKRGSLTLPVELREALAIGEGDIVEFRLISVHRDGRSKPVGDFTRLPRGSPSPAPL